MCQDTLSRWVVGRTNCLDVELVDVQAERRMHLARVHRVQLLRPRDLRVTATCANPQSTRSALISGRLSQGDHLILCPDPRTRTSTRIGLRMSCHVMCPMGFVPKSPGSPKFPSFCSAASASWLGVGFGMSSVLYRLRNGPPRKRQQKRQTEQVPAACLLLCNKGKVGWCSHLMECACWKSCHWLATVSASVACCSSCFSRTCSRRLIRACVFQRLPCSQRR